jgi:hypothetical protein
MDNLRQKNTISVAFAVASIILCSLIIINCSREPTPGEEADVRLKLSDVLQENQAVDIYYTDFRAHTDKSTTLRDYFTTFKYVEGTKTSLLKQLTSIWPTARYLRLHQIITDSLNSDIKVIKLEEQSMREMLAGLEEMKKMTGRQYKKLPPTATEKEKYEAAVKFINDYSNYFHDWLDKAKKTDAALKSALSASIASTRILNEEMEKLNLPYSHENPFQAKNTTSQSTLDSPSQQREGKQEPGAQPGAPAVAPETDHR